MTRTITAIYDSENDARRAREQLLDTGVDEDDVRIVSQNLSRTAVSSDDHKGVWESIKDFFVGDEDRPMYSEGLRRGGYLLTARVDDSRSDEAIALLEQTDAVDLDRRSEQWRSEGWSDAAVPPSSMSGYAPGAGPTTDTVRSQVAGASGATARREGMRDTEEQSIPVVEERLSVGKREVNRGGVRVRSYVVEEPVHDEVALREERVAVERRPVSDTSARNIGDAAFQERTIEVTERAEEPVIAKDAVVKEEVVVRKTADERKESIDDTVRRTEVDVDDTTGKAGSRTTRGSNSKKRT